MTNRLLCILLSVATASCAGAGCASRGSKVDEFAAGAALADAAKAFYADHGRWPRDVDELPGFDPSAFRTVELRKRPVYGGLEVRFTPSSARGVDPEVRMYIPPPRSWSPRGVRTQPAPAPGPAETQPATQRSQEPRTAPLR